METRKVKTKINQLFALYDGTNPERYEKLAKDLHIKSRMVRYLVKGEHPASFYVAREIDRLLEEKT